MQSVLVFHLCSVSGHTDLTANATCAKWSLESISLKTQKAHGVSRFAAKTSKSQANVAVPMSLTSLFLKNLCLCLKTTLLSGVQYSSPTQHILNRNTISFSP